MSDEEYANLINERQELKWELRQLTRHLEDIEEILNRIDEIEQEIGI